MCLRPGRRVLFVAVVLCLAVAVSGWAGEGVVRTHANAIPGQYMVMLSTTGSTAAVAKELAQSYNGRLERASSMDLTTVYGACSTGEGVHVYLIDTGTISPGHGESHAGAPPGCRPNISLALPAAPQYAPILRVPEVSSGIPVRPDCGHEFDRQSPGGHS